MKQEQYVTTKAIKSMLKLSPLWLSSTFSFKMRLSMNKTTGKIFRGYWTLHDQAWSTSYETEFAVVFSPALVVQWVVLYPLSRDPLIIETGERFNLSSTFAFLNQARVTQKQTALKSVRVATRRAIKLVHV